MTDPKKPEELSDNELGDVSGGSFTGELDNGLTRAGTSKGTKNPKTHQGKGALNRGPAPLDGADKQRD